MIERFLAVRAATETLAEPLSAEDQQVQSMPACSPVKWHRAHTTWFFDAMILAPRGIESRRPGWGYLFNSYYEALGPRHPRPARGVLSRPGVDEVGAWRREVDADVVELLRRHPDDEDLRGLIELGLAHEEQHQELILTDVLHAFSLNPLDPIYRPAPRLPRASEARRSWAEHDGGLVEIGRRGPGFAFDNEGPRHKAWLEPFAIGDRLVTIGEWTAFAEDGGYERPELWLSEGWDWARREGIRAPMHLRRDHGHLSVFTLHGRREPDPAEPVSHLSYYEADALARYLGARLPTEAEWEVWAEGRPVDGPLRGDALIPRPTASPFGSVWQWTASPYAPYPGYRPAAGAIGEYNGKFMVNQLVLRGGSCLTPPGHVRASYRNFWPADTRFQATGLRLARDRA
jgi:ergothioneine biosynthesis protein EgtB